MDNGLNNGVWRETPDYRTKNGQKNTGRPEAWARVPVPGKRTLFWAHLDAIPMALDGRPELQAMDEEFEAVKKRKQIDYFASWYVRSGKWNLIGWNSDAPLLFGVANDPGEYKNLAAQNPETVSELRREFLNWMEGNKPPNVGKKEIWQSMLD